MKVRSFSGSADDFFGYRVLQYRSDNLKQIIVSAPLHTNQSGAIYTCREEEQNCTLLYQPGLEGLKFFGLSVAVTSSPSASFTSCSPSLVHECDGNSYLNGVCSQFNSSLNPVSTFTSAYEECTKSNVNLVFMFDGSSSMRDEDFKKNKDFIWDIVTKLKNTSIQFAAAQFSTNIRTVFDFNDYINGTAKKKLNDEEHMKALTNTHRSIRFILDNLFENKTSGADPEATKALVIITDGSPSDRSSGELKRCDELNIKRFIIGVGNVNLQSLTDLASEPKHNNTFKIENYNGLNGLLDQLQNKIYSIEGTQAGPSRKWMKELSQSGFSAAVDQDTLILGAVGSNEWQGSLYEVTGSGSGIREVEVKENDLNEDSYSGYSVVVGRRGGVSLMFSGAPRSNYTGQVTLFMKKNRQWEATTRTSGEQLGSYFGGSLCVLDVDSDANTDFLVVGAPLYHQAYPKKEGRMYVYTITRELKLVRELVLNESAQGRFASTVAPIVDLNGDGLQDLAVGAPLEDGGRGAVYIYLGNQKQGIRPHYSQRILARSISEDLQQFGVAIDGAMDMGQDGLTDIAVGARGAVILLRARPVLSVSAEISFSPSNINLGFFDCLAFSENSFPVSNLSICFRTTETTNSSVGLSAGLNVSYELKADAVRLDSRAFLIEGDTRSRSVQKSEVLRSERSCFNHTLYMPNCVRDTLSPVLLQLNFSQSDQQPVNSSAVLDIDSRTTAYVEVPFQINCRNKSSCRSDLTLDFHFLNSSLVVVDQDYFIITVSLSNDGDDSFNTSVVLHYPPGLSLSKFPTIKANRRTLSSCGVRDDGALDKTTCSISSPVYRRGTHAEFLGVFRISRHYNWNKTMEMKLIASSDNNINSTAVTVMKSLPVQFAVDVAVRPVVENSVTYLNFSVDDLGPKPHVIVYEVRNLGLKELPVSVSFTLPAQIGTNFSVSDHTITTNPQVSVRAELVIPPDMVTIISMGGAGGLLLLIIIIVLLFKCGFFKRKRPSNSAEEEPGSFQDDETSNKDTSEEPAASPEPEENLLVPGDKQSENGGVKKDQTME
ncbi:integrin alpha-D [Trichomycterus rosablanca]|uniref:integrin alpha-D n=1 Tax=Trichomycterus rosablanca TaxID=2290929 RepID=UPI002F356F6A